MSPQQTISAHGRQMTLMEIMGKNQGQPQLTQRAAKRQKRRQATPKPDYMCGQQTLSMSSNIWNMKEIYKEDKRKLEKEYWGDNLILKQDGKIRFVSKNIQGLGLSAGNPKEDELKSWIVNKNIDVIGIQEPNINWHKCKNKDRFNEHMKGPAWEYLRYSVAYNKHDCTCRHQFGGSITMSVDQITHRVSGSGADDIGLGRWSWLLMKGRNKSLVRIITAYQPNISKNPLQSGTVYSQHRKYFCDKGLDVCPVQKFQDN